MYCWNLPSSIALDGADLKTNPQDHTVHCLRDIPECRESGYAILKKINHGSSKRSTTDTPRYEIAYILDPTGNENALAIINKTKTEKNFVVTATGTVNTSQHPNILMVDSIKESPESGQEVPEPTEGMSGCLGAEERKQRQ
jgi:hypothetical protein